jgi:hypothetical protein
LSYDFVLSNEMALLILFIYFTICGSYFRTVLRIRDVLSRIRTFSYPGSRYGSKHFFIPDPRSWILHGMKHKNYLFSVKKIIHSGSGSRIRKKFIPDQGGKKHWIPDPDPQHCFRRFRLLILCTNNRLWNMCQ